MKRGAPHRRGDRAFTLIEMMAVLLLLALIAGVALPAFGRGGGAEAENDATEIGAAIEYARRGALVTREPHRLVLDLGQSSWWLEHEPRTFADQAPRESGELPSWADARELPSTPPAATSGGFQPILDFVGAGSVLRDSVRFVGAETSDGWIEQGKVVIELWPDGSADPTELVLEAENGDQVLLRVESLDETVRIRRVED